MLLASPEDDPEGPIHPRVVEEVFVRASPLLALRVCGREIRTTNEHPFYVQGKGWVKAWLLSPGDLLRTADGRWLPVESIADTGDVATVYNFRVAEYHTYYVGSPHWGFAVWSHNASYSPGDKAPSSWKRYLTKLVGSAPASMLRAHAHHIVMKLGNRASKAMQEAVNESKAILDSVGINWLLDAENLCWAPNHGHSIEYAQKVLKELRQAIDSGEGKEAVVKALKSIADRLADGTFL